MVPGQPPNAQRPACRPTRRGRGSDACSPGSPLRAAERVSGASVFRYTLVGSAERPATRIGRRPQHRMVPGPPPNAQNPRTGRPAASKASQGVLDGSTFGDPRALIGPRCACLRPARASLSLGKLPPYHTMTGCSLDPRAEPISRRHDRCAPHDRRAEMERCRLRFREIRVSRVNYRVEDPVHFKV